MQTCLILACDMIPHEATGRHEGLTGRHVLCVMLWFQFTLALLIALLFAP